MNSKLILQLAKLIKHCSEKIKPIKPFCNFIEQWQLLLKIAKRAWLDFFIVTTSFGICWDTLNHCCFNNHYSMFPVCRFWPLGTVIIFSSLLLICLNLIHQKEFLAYITFRWSISEMCSGCTHVYLINHLSLNYVCRSTN